MNTETDCQFEDSIIAPLLREWSRLKRVELDFDRIKSMGSLEASCFIPSVAERMAVLEKRLQQEINQRANPQPCGCPFCGAERKLNRMNPRLDELLERLVAVGNPHSKFSASEFHELYDGVQEIEDERVKLHACLSRLSADYKSIGSIMEEVESLIMYENRKRMD